MSDEPIKDDATWLLEPPGAGEVHLHIATGEGVELSPEGREALDTLLRELQGQEVEGYSVLCPSKGVCNPQSCGLDNCQPLVKQPCAIDYRCKIAEFGGMG